MLIKRQTKKLCYISFFEIAMEYVQMVKNLLVIWETSLIPGWGRSLGEGHGNPFQYFCLENPRD